jgi:hypothetical protein
VNERAIHDHALHSIRTIRDAMERASAFTSIPGWGGFAIGVTAVGTAIFASYFVSTPRLWLTMWIAEAAVAVVIAAITMFLKARRANVSLMAAPARRFFISYSAPLIAAALITITLARAQMFSVLPAVWLLLYGASFISSGSFSIPVVPVMGIAFMVLGLAACFVPLLIGNILMGAGFGGLHVVFGLAIARRYGG